MNISVNYGCYVGRYFIPFNIDIVADAKYYSELKNLLKINRVSNFYFQRVGRPNDGGYIMIDDFNSGDKVAYSFGINDDVSWDDSMADKEFQIYMYDPTIAQLPKTRTRFHFFKEGLSGEYNPDTLMNTLENLIKRNGHQNLQNMILKIDIEGSEWDFLNEVKSEVLNQFDQILFELHNVVRGGDKDILNKKLSALKKLNKTHQLVHLHGNNSGYYLYVDGVLYPDVLEATYIKKEKYDTYEDNIFLPIPLDAPCDPSRGDLVLGYWNSNNEQACR